MAAGGCTNQPPPWRGPSGLQSRESSRLFFSGIGWKQSIENSSVKPEHWPKVRTTGLRRGKKSRDDSRLSRLDSPRFAPQKLVRAVVAVPAEFTNCTVNPLTLDGSPFTGKYASSANWPPSSDPAK